VTRWWRNLKASEGGPLIVRAAALGALVLAVLVLVAVISSSGATYEVRATFEDVRGLIPGGEVRAGSAHVGEVTDIELDSSGLPVVTMEVDDDFRLRQGAFANIRLASNVGGVNRFVDLTQGTGPPLPDGSTLGPSKTDQPVDLDLAVSDLDPRTREKASELLAALDRTLRGRGADIDLALRHGTEALGETANVLAQVTSDRLALSRLVGDGRKVVGALAASPSDLGSSAERLADVLDVTAGRQAELARAIRALGPGLSNARATLARLDQAIPNLTSLTVALRPAVDEIVPTVREIRPAIAALRPLIAEARKLIDAAPAQLRKIEPVLAAAQPVLRYLNPLVTGFGPMLDYLRAFGPEVINFFSLLADTTSSYDAAGNLIRSTVPAIQGARHPNLIGPSDPGPGLVERPFFRTPGSLEGEPWTEYWKSFIGGGEPVESYLDDPSGR
jgi:phospholipid/cholesterol/gamma-HCH transport system substrate-binding protein